MHLEKTQDSSHPVIRTQSPQDLVERATEYLDGGTLEYRSHEDVTLRARAMVQEILSSTTQLHSPNCMGHQVNPPIPIAGAFTGLGGVLNPGLAIFEMGQFIAALERALIAKLGRLVGWPEGNYDGIITNGGTLANLTAILTARNKKFPHIFTKGIGASRPALLVGADSHYSISRAAGVLGFGTAQVIKIPLDGKRRMNPKHLAEKFESAVQMGLEPFAIVAAAGSTPFGAFDPLEEIGKFAKLKELWLHVDGAHGGPFLFSQKHKHLLQGIESADSITWDAHKTMFVPSLCTFLLYKEKRDSYLSFQQDAPYIFGDGEQRAAFDAGLRTFECTKGPIALPVWALWSLFSEKLFAELIEKVLGATATLYEMVEAAPDFKALHIPECNIFCFRYLPTKLKENSEENRDQLQRRLRESIVADGRFYITGTVIDGEYALRVTVSNPATEREHFASLLEKIRSLYEQR